MVRQGIDAHQAIPTADARMFTDAKQAEEQTFM